MTRNAYKFDNTKPYGTAFGTMGLEHTLEPVD